jgi:hypothetical protein
MKQSKQKELQLSINGGLVSWNRNLVAWCVFFFILLRLSMCTAGDDIVVYIVARVSVLRNHPRQLSKPGNGTETFS